MAPLYGADDPRLERRRRQAYLQQPPDGERGDDHPRSAGAWPADWRRGAHDVAERRLGAGAAYPPERGDAVVSGQHTPNRMAKQVYNGLAGMWLVEDEVSKNLPIPTTMASMTSR